MGIKDFIQNEILLPRLKKSGVLIIYDPQRRYRELCLELAAENQRVVDASESSIESREQALATLQQLGEPNAKLESLLVYVPAQRPLSGEDQQEDPFSIYGVCGETFPDGDGDEFQSLCLKAKPDHATEIRRVFAENSNPPFAVIDAIGAGTNWPNLQALLKADSAREILLGLLVPADSHKEALKGNDGWVSEAKELFRTCLGLHLLTRGKTWASIGDELWRFVLFSEFAFDLPCLLPDALANVPRAPAEARPLVEDLCDKLRSDKRTQAAYIDRAETIEHELNLPSVCASIEDLGVRDTFPFEERSFLAQAIEALKRDNIDRVRQIRARHADSVWVGKGENQAQWQLLQSAVCLAEACEDAGRQLPDHARSQETLIDFYVVSLREVDRLQREFEQAVNDYLDVTGGMKDVIQLAQTAYRRLVSQVQDLFIKHLETTGWPPAGRLSNADVFDRMVGPRLSESGRRVALVLVDALRYELGVALGKQLAEDGQVETQPAFAQVPSVTTVGMASLLPGAGQGLRLVNRDGEAVPALDGVVLSNVTQRMELLAKRYGERFAETTLPQFVKGKFKPAESVELLVLRSTTIDSNLEATPETTLGVVYDTLNRIRMAIHKLAALGFHEVVIASDHGFFLNTQVEAGDVASKPPGHWVNFHDRCLLGSGAGDAFNFVLPAERLGVRGDFTQVAGPRALVAYAAGHTYFHGGASLQETVVPVITVRLGTRQQAEPKHLEVTLSYKRGAKRITTRLPVIDVAVRSADLFSAGAELEFLLEAHDKKGDVVGEAKGAAVNPATRTITLKSGETAQITLRMEMEFEGKFTVKALDPVTLATHHKLDLETDYTV